MEPFSSDELAAWLDGQYAEVLEAENPDYKLKPGEWTAASFAEEHARPITTVRRMFKTLREAGRIEVKQEKMGRRWVWVYTIAKETE